MTINKQTFPSKATLVLAGIVVLSVAYGFAVTPLAYREARRMVLVWAAEQPDLVVGGMTMEQINNYKSKTQKTLPPPDKKETVGPRGIELF